MNKFAGYKINRQIPILLLYTNSEISEEEIKKIPFTIVPKTIKYNT